MLYEQWFATLLWWFLTIARAAIVLWLISNLVAFIKLRKADSVSMPEKSKDDNQLESGNVRLRRFTSDDLSGKAMSDLGIIIVMVMTQGAGPARAMLPVLANVAAKHPEVVVGTFDVDTQPCLEVFSDIRYLPSLVVFNHGCVIKCICGAMREDQLENEFADILE